MMARFYCPQCWADFPEEPAHCPHCGLDIQAFWQSRDYVERLIVALNHPEKSTPVRAAWLLGELRDPRAAGALIELVNNSRDVYIARAAVGALAKIGTSEAVNFIKTLCEHPAVLLREEARKIVRQRVGPSRARLTEHAVR